MLSSALPLNNCVSLKVFQSTFDNLSLVTPKYRDKTGFRCCVAVPQFAYLQALVTASIEIARLYCTGGAFACVVWLEEDALLPWEASAGVRAHTGHLLRG